MDDITAALFLILFEYTLEKDDKLADIANDIPKNAKYRYNDIQSKIIEILTSSLYNFFHRPHVFICLFKGYSLPESLSNQLASTPDIQYIQYIT